MPNWISGRKTLRLFHPEINFGFIFDVPLPAYQKIGPLLAGQFEHMGKMDRAYLYGRCPLGPRGRVAAALINYVPTKLNVNEAVHDCVDAISGHQAIQKYAILVTDKSVVDYFPKWQKICHRTDTLLVVVDEGINQAMPPNIQHVLGNADSITLLFKEIYARRKHLSSTSYSEL